jgi:hypothetical protein
MHVKLGATYGWDFGAAAVEAVRLSARGLVGADRAHFVKRAGATAPALFAALRDGRLRPGESPVHAIAVGAHELWGVNRNGDGYTAATLARHHDSFVKRASWYRHHDHHPHSPRYGRIVASAYNPALGRVEVVGALYATKRAAADGAGDKGRIADTELDLLGRGEDVPVSKGSRVKTDVCMCCGNRARSRAEYCTADTCPAGGCARNLARVVKLASGELTQVGVDNPEPVFFDLSTVGRPAAPYAFAAPPAG